MGLVCHGVARWSEAAPGPRTGQETRFLSDCVDASMTQVTLRRPRRATFGTVCAMSHDEQHLRWQQRPPLRSPVLVAAFEGWNDAGEGASTAIAYLREHFSAVDFADIDPEDFFDFTQSRPMITFDSAGERRVEWPQSTFSAAHPAGEVPDLILLAGTEPGLRWQTYCRQVLAVCRAFDVHLVVTLGALLAEVPHSRPVSVISTAFSTSAARRLQIEVSGYQGPTGIVGVLHDACRSAGIDSAGVWATVPSYLPGAPSPKASLALVQRLSDLLGLHVTTTELEIAASSYERQIEELVSDDEETSQYITALEERWDQGDEPELTTSIADEVERFLRDQ